MRYLIEIDLTIPEDIFNPKTNEVDDGSYSGDTEGYIEQELDWGSASFGQFDILSVKKAGNRP